MNGANVTLDTVALQAIAEQAEGAAIILAVEVVEEATLSEEQQDALADQDVALVLTALILADGEPIGDFKGGSVTVATPDGLCSIPVTTGGSYADVSGQQWLADEIDLVRGVVVQRIGKVVLDGVTAGRMAASKSSNTKANTYNISTDDWGRAIGTDVVLTVSHYPYHGTAGGSGYVTMDGVMICDVPGGMYVGHNSITTLEDYNTWLAAQHAAGTPVTVLYPLAEPVETPLTGEVLAAAARLCSLYPVTTITAEGAWIAAQYIADTKTYIDNRFAELAAQLIEA
jgi:hypothetical protein